ncbi:hypothetical protein Poly59_37150 [Rubripirellula reticaptiva]|uniref:Uncharacterized protein n=1 Tax=Rubripirellula reticaptiva TaxID=2528013 RepID=A0A5C6EJ41_9BACT|nr:hypothetical protein Poly59_37150 [Rubripirellula reticaptiva]
MLSFQSSLATSWLDASTDSASRFWKMAHRRLLPRSKGGVETGSFRVPWLALHSPTSVRGDSQPLVLHTNLTKIIRSEDVLSGELLTMEQVRRATDLVIETMGMS